MAPGLHVQPTHLRLVLPFGISFFTFETMSYTIDVYRKELPPAERYLDYLLFVCFFPHLVAGPIVRPHTMLPQLAETPVMDADQHADGMWRIAQGLFKKVVIGDFLSENLVKLAFGNPERYSSLEVVIAVYAYAIQIYCDFSGYTDVAIGSAQLFGYRLPPNFDRPYLSLDLQDFWRRWHISLSSWLRDYLYIPLGGSKHGTWKTYRNLFLTMLLGGLWHGAGWTFIVWGALHGGMLAVNRWVSQHRPFGAWRLPRWLSIFLTFQFVCFAWIFFRASSFELAMVDPRAHRQGAGEHRAPVGEGLARARARLRAPPHPSLAHRAGEDRVDALTGLRPGRAAGALRLRAAPRRRRAGASHLRSVLTQTRRANLSVASTRALVIPGSLAACPASPMIDSSASGHARWSAQALASGQTTS